MFDLAKPDRIRLFGFHYDGTVLEHLEDPIGFAGGWNQYQYVDGNPINFSDPEGLRPRFPSRLVTTPGGEVAGHFVTGAVKGVGSTLVMAGLVAGATIGTPLVAGVSTGAALTLAAIGGYGLGNTGYAIGSGRDPTTGAPISGQQRLNMGAEVLGGAAAGGFAGNQIAGWLESRAASAAAVAQEQYLERLRAAGYEPAVAITTYDALTGKSISGTNGDIPESVNPELLEAAARAGGLGVKTASGNTIGRCAEFRTANDLTNLGSYLKNVRFTPAFRLSRNKTIPPCPNCMAIFGPNLTPGTAWWAILFGSVFGATGSSVGQ